jgi:amino acid transporter
MVGMVVPSNDPSLLQSTGNASQSPFVVAARRAGIHAVPSITIAAVPTSAWSVGNSNMLGGSRILFGLAMHEHALKSFTRANQFGVPYSAVALIGVFMGLGYIMLSGSASTAFTWLQDIVSVSTLMN